MSGFRAFTAAVLCLALVGCPKAPGPRRFIRDEAGRALTLHGVNMSGTAKGDPERLPWVERDDVLRLSRDWGFNFVRYLVLWDGLAPAPGAYDEAYLDKIAERIEWCREAGLYVVLDMHQDLWSIAFGGDGAPEWATLTDGLEPIPLPPGSPWWLSYAQPPVGRAFDNFWRNKEGLQDAYAEAWVRLVERFKDDPIVLGYDLMNEPFSGTSNLAEFEDRRLRPFYERVIRRIREVDADSWIWVEPAALAVNFGMGSRLGVVADAREGDPRIVYFPHFYQVDVHEGGPYDGDSFFIDLWEAYRSGEVAKMDAPLVIGEFGAFSGLPGHLRHLRDIIAMIDRAGSGFAYWDYSPGGGFSPIDADRSEREQIQALVRVYPRAVAGDPVSQTFDPETGVFELTFTTSAAKRPQGALPAPTEIYVGATRLYPGGWAVSSSDPDGAWSSSYDAAAEVLSVWHDPGRAEHTLRIAPAEAPS